MAPEWQCRPHLRSWAEVCRWARGFSWRRGHSTAVQFLVSRVAKATSSPPSTGFSTKASRRRVLMCGALRTTQKQQITSIWRSSGTLWMPLTSVWAGLPQR